MAGLLSFFFVRGYEPQRAHTRDIITRYYPGYCFRAPPLSETSLAGKSWKSFLNIVEFYLYSILISAPVQETCFFMLPADFPIPFASLAKTTLNALFLVTSYGF